MTSHLYSFGIRGKQFQFEGGKLPENVKFHGRLTDNDVRTIQNAGGRVEIVEAHFTEEELERARKAVGLTTDPARRYPRQQLPLSSLLQFPQLLSQ
ncbi:hypothetical protein [Tunturiibacter psychrotolerans]|uniref:hypothetical protein n=1 Tax=Tunturiibacter psychrotolerans TaxID=3069686 RepID=UPI003D25E57F